MQKEGSLVQVFTYMCKCTVCVQRAKQGSVSFGFALLLLLCTPRIDGRKGKPAPGSENSFFRCRQAPRRSEDNPKLDANLQI